MTAHALICGMNFSELNRNCSAGRRYTLFWATMILQTAKGCIESFSPNLRQLITDLNGAVFSFSGCGHGVRAETRGARNSTLTVRRLNGLNLSLQKKRCKKRLSEWFFFTIRFIYREAGHPKYSVESGLLSFKNIRLMLYLPAGICTSDPVMRKSLISFQAAQAQN